MKMGEEGKYKSEIRTESLRGENENKCRRKGKCECQIEEESYRETRNENDAERHKQIKR